MHCLLVHRLSVSPTRFIRAAIGIALALALGAAPAPVQAEPKAGVTSGPWRCQVFDLEQRVAGNVADWLYKNAASGPDNVLVLSGTGRAQGYVTLCAWDSGFAAAHWLAQEEERKRHDAEVDSRRQELRKMREDEGGRLFSDEAVDFDEDEKNKKNKKKGKKQ